MMPRIPSRWHAAACPSPSALLAARLRAAFPAPLAAACVAAAAALAAASAAQAQPAPELLRSYAIPATTLDDALGRFGRASGALVAADPELTAGLRSPGLEGRHTVGQGLARLLAGTGLEAAPTAEGGYALRRTPVAAPGAARSLDEVRVTARAERSATTEGSGSYAADVVTIGKGEQSPREIAQAVSVITQQRLQDQGLTDIKSALVAAAPGVSMVSNEPGGHFYSRGFLIGSYQFDGVPLERQLYARGSAFNTSMALYDRVELMRGPQGLFEGAGDPSGSVNLVRKRPTAERQAVLTAKAGSWNERGAQADLGGPLNAGGTLRGRLVLDYSQADSFRDHFDTRERTAYAALDADIAPGTTLGVGFSRETPEGSLDWTGLPNNGDGSMPAFARSTNLSTPWSRAGKTQDTWYADLAHSLGGDWKLKASLVRVHEANALKYLLRTGRLGPPVSMRGDVYDFDMVSRNLGGDAYVTGSTQVLGRKLSVTAGANFSHQRSHDLWGWQRDIESLNGSADQPALVPEPATADTLAANRMDDGYRSDKKGVYAMGRYELAGPLSLVLGGRWSRYRQTYASDGIWGYSESTAQERGKLTPFAGLIHPLSPQWSAYGSYADIFRPQSQRAASGEFLAPVTGKTLELGLKGELPGGRAQASFALFRTAQKNVALEDASVDPEVADARCAGTCYRSSARMRSQGVEAEVTGEVARGLQLSASYTYTHTRYRGTDVPSVGYDISANTGVPRHMARLWAGYRLPGTWNAVTVGGGLRSQSRAADFGYDGREQGGYTVVDARLAYRFTPRLSAALNIGNVTDKTYFRSISYGRNFYGTPRSVLLTLQYRL